MNRQHNQKSIGRRTLLKGAMFGAGAAAFSRSLMAAVSRAAATQACNQQVLFVFLRGGNDATNTIVPVGDAEYSLARPSLALSGTSLSPIKGANYTKRSASLDRLEPLDTAGKIAWIHRVGDPAAKRSHFIAMDMFETAAEETVSLSALAGYPGFVNKVLSVAGIPSLGPGNMPAATSIAPRLQRMFRTDQVSNLAAHAHDLTDLGLPYPVPGAGLEAVLDLHAQDHIAAPANPTDGLLASNLAFGIDTRAALAGLNFTRQFSPTNLRFPVTAADLAAVQANFTGDPALIPTYNASGGAFMGAAEQALFALRNAPSMRVAGVDFGGWDTHGNQPQQHPNLLRYLGWALRDLYDTMSSGSGASPITIVVVSEFGRTNRENSGSSTDHGVGGAYLVVGDNVRGGTYNCHEGNGAQGPREFGAPWLPLLTGRTLPRYDNALDVATDFRDVIAEICSKLFCIPDSDLDQVIPGYQAPITPWLDFLT